MGYFRVKAGQERVVEAGTVPWSSVRATRFDEFVATSLAAQRRRRQQSVARPPLHTPTTVHQAEPRGKGDHSVDPRV